VAVEPVAPERVPVQVPEYVRATQHDFRRCPRCRKIYWPATHRAHMDDEIAALELTTPTPAGGDGAQGAQEVQEVNDA